MDQVAELDRIVAVGLLTRRDLDLLGPTFDRVWPVEDTPRFSELLKAIDEADRQLGGVGSVRGIDEMDR
jgi:hypothetical protein